MSPEKPVPETRPLEAPVLDRETRTPMTRMAKLEVSRVFAPEDLKRALHCLADCGWNAVVLPGVFEGYPIFFSQVWADYGLRRQHPKFRKWNPFEIAFEVASKRGFEVLVSHEPYVVQRLAHRHTSAILRRYPDWEAKRHPKRKKRRAEDTQKGEMFYCPVNRDYRRFLSSMLHVLLEEYPIHGLVLDLRHYPFYLTDDNDYVPYCYCDACRDATLRDLGFDPISVDFESEKGMVRRWREWQSEQMDNALRYIRARALKARTSMRVIGLLTSDVGLAATHRAPLIHWRAWIDRSLVEALTLDRYTPDLENFESQILHDLETLPDNSLLLPMLPRQVENGDDFLQIFRALPLPGFVTRFENWDQPGFDPTQRVAFDTPAFPLESDPIRSVCVLFENMADLAPAEEEFSAFLMDLAKILARGSDNLPVERLLTVADNVRGLHEQVAEGRLDFGQQQDQILHDLNLAYRLVYLAICDLKQ